MTQPPLQVGDVVQPIAHVDLPQRTDYKGEFIQSDIVPLTQIQDVISFHTPAECYVYRE